MNSPKEKSLEAKSSEFSLHGIYIREPDGAQHLYHNPQTVWNSPPDGLRSFLEARYIGQRWAFDPDSLWYWRHVTDAEEIKALHEHIGKASLKAGEWVVLP